MDRAKPEAIGEGNGLELDMEVWALQEKRESMMLYKC